MMNPHVTATSPKNKNPMPINVKNTRAATDFFCPFLEYESILELQLAISCCSAWFVGVHSEMKEKKLTPQEAVVSLFENISTLHLFVFNHIEMAF